MFILHSAAAFCNIVYPLHTTKYPWYPYPIIYMHIYSIFHMHMYKKQEYRGIPLPVLSVMFFRMFFIPLL